jgi:hypothetical protein
MSRKVAGSTPDVFFETFYLRNLSGRTMDLESTHSMTEMSTRSISFGLKAAGA